MRMGSVWLTSACGLRAFLRVADEERTQECTGCSPGSEGLDLSPLSQARTKSYLLQEAWLDCISHSVPSRTALGFPASHTSWPPSLTPAQDTGGISQACQSPPQRHFLPQSAPSDNAPALALSALLYLPSPSALSILEGEYYYYPHFAEKDTETQKG